MDYNESLRNPREYIKMQKICTMFAMLVFCDDKELENLAKSTEIEKYIPLKKLKQIHEMLEMDEKLHKLVELDFLREKKEQ